MFIFIQKSSKVIDLFCIVPFKGNCSAFNGLTKFFNIINNIPACVKNVSHNMHSVI